MPAFTTEGIIIKRRNFGEADRILTMLTPFRGKITVMAKGVRRITSRRGGNVELLNRVNLHLFQGSGMPVLSEAESVETYDKLKSDLVLSSYASHIMELLDRLIAENQANPEVYQLAKAALDILQENPRQVFIRAFEVKLLSILGFWSLSQVETSAETKNLLEKLGDSDWLTISRLKISKEQALEVERILRYYIEKVLESSLKSVQIIQKLKDKK